MPSVADDFHEWCRLSSIANDARWAHETRFEDLYFVRDLVRLISDDLEGVEATKRPEEVSSMASLADAICEDVQRRLQPWVEGRDLSEQTIGALLITVVCTRVAWAALMKGDLRVTREWLMRPIRGQEDEEHYDYIAPKRAAIFFHEAQPLPDGLVVPVLSRWAEILFVYDRFRGGVDIVSGNVFELLQPWIVQRLPTMPELGHLALAAAEWSCRRSVDDTDLEHSLMDFAESDTAPVDLRRPMAVHFAETASARGEDPVAAASAALKEFTGQLTGTEMLRLVSVLALHLPEAAARDIARVTRAIDACMRDWRTTTPDPLLMTDRRGAHFTLVGNIAEGLLAAERPDLIGDVFGAWLEVAPHERRRDLLYWFATDSPGVGWATRDSVEIGAPPRDPPDFARALNRFLGVALSVRDAEWFEAEPPLRHTGEPNPEFATELLDVGREILRLDRLDELLRGAALPPQALVVLPYGAFPVQSTLIREFGRSWPWSVSLRKPHPDRGAELARIVLTGTALGVREVEGVAQVLEEGGIGVDLVIEPDMGRARFLDLYSDPAPDILWIVGHGTFDWQIPRASHLLMPDGSQIDAVELASVPEVPERRLLVLNVCEAAMALISGGLPEFGVGVSAAQPSQAVIGHAWPVVGWPDGALFGRLLADGIVKRLGYFGAFENSVRTLIAGTWSVLKVIDGSGGELDDGLRRAIENRHGERLSELSTWGSAAFLE